MVLMKPGVWHDTVWADRTWTEDLWLEYGAAAPPSPTPRGGTAWFPPYPRPKRPNFIEDNRDNLLSGSDASIVIYDEGDLLPWLHHLT